MYDLVIEKGRVIDPKINFDGEKTIAILDGKIVPFDSNIEAKTRINAAGYYVLPGLIDFHTHVYYGGSSFSVKPELLFSTGVTSVVDAGSSGVINFEDFYRNIINQSMVKIKAYLNISSIGQLGGGIEESLDPKLFDIKKIAQLIEKYPDTILGLKIRCSKYLCEHYGMEPMLKTLKIAKDLNVPVCVHTTEPPIDASELVALLNKDDIYCHVFQGTGSTILDQQNLIKPEFWEAKKRGVVFDAANGRFNFDFDIAEPALKEDFFPDIISSDTTTISLNIPGNAQVKNLPFLMSKYLNMGMKLHDIVQAVTTTPATLMKMQNVIGTLQEGAIADVCISKIENTTLNFIDSNKSVRQGELMFVVQATIANGQIVYCSTNF